MTTTKKQTARNNAFLADVKHIFNKPLFDKATKMVNEWGAEGEAEFRAYLLKWITRDADCVNALGSGKRYY